MQAAKLVVNSSNVSYSTGLSFLTQTEPLEQELPVFKTYHNGHGNDTGLFFIFIYHIYLSIFWILILFIYYLFIYLFGGRGISVNELLLI